jgi:CRISPR-associated protein Csb1
MTIPTTIEPTTLAESADTCRLVLKATLEPVAGLDRFQPAGFPEIGHVIYKAPRSNGAYEPVCIVDSPASMANHLETVCLRGSHDPTLVEELSGMPYVRCVTDPELESGERPLVVTTLTEGHRLASTYFLQGKRIENKKPVESTFGEELRKAFGLIDLDTKTHPLPAQWWKVFTAIFRYDPSSLVHGILFPKWQVKIPRLLTAHLEAFGASRVTSSGVKFDRLGKTTSGQPIFSKDEEVAQEIRATFILDLALLRSFGRDNAEQAEQAEQVGLTRDQKAFLAALALWKVGRLLRASFRFRSQCDLTCTSLCAALDGGTSFDVSPAALADIEMKEHIQKTQSENRVTDVYWRKGDLFKSAPEQASRTDSEDEDNEEETGENEG